MCNASERGYFQEAFGNGVKKAKTSPVNIICATCKGENVRRDAFAEWNIAKQHWELGILFDQGYCEDCDGESRLEEVLLRHKNQTLRIGLKVD
jgi:hypothetical protein